MKTVLGGVFVHGECTKGDHKSYECPACGWVFPGVMWNGVSKKPINECSLRKRFKAAFKRLEAAGVVEKGKCELMSVGSCRKGGCSGACAYGVRDVLRQKHGRWGLTAREKKVGGYSGAGVQRAVIIGTRVSDEVVERLAERAAARGTGLRGN